LWVRGKGGSCYAGSLHEDRLAKSLPALYAPDFTEVRLAPGRMAKAAAWSDLRGKERPGKPWLNGLPRLVFVGDMGDMFSADVPFKYLAREIIETAESAKGRRHIWMLLTKQAKRAYDFAVWLHERGVKWPENVWQGVSVTGEKTKRRAEIASCHPAPVKFLSVEPMLGLVGFSRSLLLNFQLVIVGGESSQGGHQPRPFNLSGLRAILRDCREAGVSAFVKQLGQHVVSRNDEVADWFGECGHLQLAPTERFQGATGRVHGFRDGHGGDWNEWPADLRVREFPNVTEAAHAR
jgi:protein gp37